MFWIIMYNVYLIGLEQLIYHFVSFFGHLKKFKDIFRDEYISELVNLFFFICFGLIL